MDTRRPDMPDQPGAAPWWEAPLTHPETADDQRRFLRRKPMPKRHRALALIIPWLLLGAVFVGIPALAIFSGPPAPRFKTRQPAPAAAEAAAPASLPQEYYCEHAEGCQRGNWLYVEPPADVLRYCHLPDALGILPAPLVTTPRGVFCLYRGDARQARTPTLTN